MVFSSLSTKLNFSWGKQLKFPDKTFQNRNKIIRTGSSGGHHLEVLIITPFYKMLDGRKRGAGYVWIHVRLTDICLQRFLLEDAIAPRKCQTKNVFVYNKRKYLRIFCTGSLWIFRFITFVKYWKGHSSPHPLLLFLPGNNHCASISQPDFPTVLSLVTFMFRWLLSWCQAVWAASGQATIAGCFNI